MNAALVPIPEPCLQARGIAPQSLFDPARPAVVDPDHRARVNYELYYFADRGARGELDADLVRLAGAAWDADILDELAHALGGR